MASVTLLPAPMSTVSASWEGRMGTQPDEKKPKAQDAASAPAKPSPYLRAENEDDDGYDPFSDRPPEREPLFERDPWS